MVFLNTGYAELESQDGVYLKPERNHFDVYRFQLYHHIVLEFGGISNLSGKMLLETGCGRGGGIHYLARELHPTHALGLDISHFQVIGIPLWNNSLSYFL